MRVATLLAAAIFLTRRIRRLRTFGIRIMGRGAGRPMLAVPATGAIRLRAAVVRATRARTPVLGTATRILVRLVLARRTFDCPRRV